MSVGLYGKASDAAKRKAAVGSLLIGAGAWGLLWYPARLLAAHGLAGPWLTFVLYGAAAVTALVYARPARSALLRHPRAGVLLALTAGVTNIAFLLALLYGNVVRVMLLFYLSPAWAILLSRLALKERLTRSAVASLVLSLAGALVMLWDPALGAPWPASGADWLGATAGVAFAAANVTLRANPGFPLSGKAMAVWLGVVPLALALIAGVDAPYPSASASVWLAAALLGGIGVQLMTWLINFGVSTLPVRRSAVLMLFELPVAAVSQDLIAGQGVGLREVIGGALILIAACLAV